MRDITSNYEDVIGKHLKILENKDDKGKLQAEIEYFAVNLKITLTGNKQLFAKLV